MKTMSCFIGYDPRQPVAFAVAAHSLWSRATIPVSITRLQLDQLQFSRTGLTEFTYSRFLVPFLSGFEGVSLFVDSDILCLANVGELLLYPMAYPDVSVFVVPHARKFERPSVMLFNNARCLTLTKEYVENPVNKLFDFAWAQKVGDLPFEWNHLVGYDVPRSDAKLVHFTQGLPVWPETRHTEYAEHWHEEARHLISTCSFAELMGPSVHVPYVQQRLAQEAQS